MLHSVESRHAARPATGAGRLKDQARDMLAAHVFVTADRLDAFTAAGALEQQGVSELSRGPDRMIGGEFHPYRVWAQQFPFHTHRGLVLGRMLLDFRVRVYATTRPTRAE